MPEGLRRLGDSDLVEGMPEGLRRLVAGAYALELRSATAIVGAGDEAAVWRVETSQGVVVVRLSPAERSTAQLAESYAWAAKLADRVPEATPPLRALDGEHLALWHGRVVSLWPYAEGAFLDRDDPSLRRSAARLLARLHRAGLELLGREVTGREVVPGLEVPGPEDPGPEDPGSSVPRGLVHGDFYERNLVCRDGRIVALIDWDDVRIERLDAELAWVTWELGKSPTGESLAPDRADAIVADYRAAGGPARPGPDFTDLIRARLETELDDDDEEYVATLRAALRTL